MFTVYVFVWRFIFFLYSISSVPLSLSNQPAGEGENDSDTLKTSYHALSITCEHLKRRLDDSEMKQKLLHKQNNELRSQRGSGSVSSLSLSVIILYTIHTRYSQFLCEHLNDVSYDDVFAGLCFVVLSYCIPITIACHSQFFSGILIDLLNHLKEKKMIRNLKRPKLDCVYI